MGDLHGIEIELVGHVHRYVVRVETGRGGPRLVGLNIVAPAGVAAPTITPAALRAIPARRLAYAAAQFAGRYDGAFALPGDTDETHHRPEAPTARNKLDDNHYREVAERVRSAVAMGAPVRKTVAAAMHTTPPTLDRWIRAAKDRGYLDENDIPRRNQPTGGIQQ